MFDIPLHQYCHACQSVQLANYSIRTLTYILTANYGSDVLVEAAINAGTSPKEAHRKCSKLLEMYT